MKHRIFFWLLLLAASSQSSAENGCPDGMTPFQNGNDPVSKCYPIQGGQSTAPSQTQGRWETRWGAIATDGVIGRYGVVINYRTKRQALKGAITQCKANGGGTACKSRISFYNQCAVIAWGDDSNFVQGAETTQIASKLALEACSKLTENCKIVYADCSPPVWIQ